MNSFDVNGHYFSPATRTAMTHLTSGDTAPFEAAAAVRVAAHAVDRLRSRGTESRGLSPAALDLLVRLGVAGEPGLTIGDLAASGGISPRNATGLVDTLEREGLARRSPDPADRRAVRVAITPPGRGWVEAFRKPSEVAMAALFRDFTDEEVVLLRHLCLKLVTGAEALS
ncbi:MarR family winged helix-turn-helix transcriptional regulator [Saccharothrix violaceirubra]|uniref:DNA-binding MarR family transcriptional regulator n=1 Tax=Saccharothrix violaceirubra TaxID=413306 RepID=A0A7W7WV81_9PSEU|nr:MarR family transcriptional regulator [Saccharothrix violaceirubra]MBB4965015.1 DNA-binding MarR family transcriptional regulator [Saccharothrix violaceirubra]